MRANLMASGAAAAMLAAGTAWAGSPIDQTREAPAAGVVVIDNLSGTIDITGWDQNQVKVKGTLGDGVERLEFSRDGDRTTVKVVYPRGVKFKGWGHGGAGETDLAVHVPKGSTVRANGVNVAVTADGVTGSLELKTVNGDIHIAGSPAEVDAGTVNGKIEFKGSSPRTHLESVNGPLEITGAHGEVEASTVNGDIHLTGGDLDRAKGSTVGGDIVFDAVPTSRGSIDLESHSGDVILYLPKSLSAEFDVSTFSGDISNELGPKAERTDRYAPGMELKFALGDGDARIEASSFSGSVEIKEKGAR
jgi:hypothetical protein